jgi:hypothetical protein
MSERKCSYETIQLYKAEIDKYLQSKGELDLSKYKVYIKDDDLFFDKWEYKDIEKPVNINPIPKTVNYCDLYTRKIIVNIAGHEENKLLHINVDGDRVTSNYIDKQNRYIQKIIESYEKVGGQWNTIESGSGVSNIYLTNGVIVINNQRDRASTRSRFKGEIHILILYGAEERKQGSAVQSVSKTTNANPMYYTFPKNY